MVVETPEQYNTNERIAAAEGNPFEIHRSLVTAEYLAAWGFVPTARYLMDPPFSNMIYARNS